MKISVQCSKQCLPSISDGSAWVVHLCMSVCISSLNSQKTIAPIFIFDMSTHEGVYSLLGRSLISSRVGSGCGLNNLSTNFSPWRDRTNYDIEVRHDVNDMSWRTWHMTPSGD